MGESLVQDVDRGVFQVGLPVSLDGAPQARDGFVVFNLYRVVEVVRVEQPVERGKVVVQRTGLPPEVDEQHAEAALGADFHQVAIAPSERIEMAGRGAVPVGGGAEPPTQVVTPAVVVHLDIRRSSLLSQHRQTTVVWANVVERAQASVVAADQQKGTTE